MADPTLVHRLPAGSNRRENGNRGTDSRDGRMDPVPGPTARRKLLAYFRTFLIAEEDFFRAIITRFAKTGLERSDWERLQSLGISIIPDDEDDNSGEQRGEDDLEKKRERRNAVLPLAHKALICFGDLARYKELYSDPGAGHPNHAPKPDVNGGDRRRKNEGGERKVKNWSKAAECYHQARLLLPDSGMSRICIQLIPTVD